MRRSRWLHLVLGVLAAAGTMHASSIIQRSSMEHGLCTVCGTSSCANCIKLTSPITAYVDEAKTACSSCRGTSAFCRDEHTTAYRTVQQDRPVCTPEENCTMGCMPPYSAFLPRSQGTNTARELAGWEEFIHQFDVGGYYLTTGHVLGYYRSYRPERIVEELFGDTVLRFTGSQVANRGRCDLLADNFGLAATYQGQLEFSPRIENIVFDSQFFIGLDPIACGLYLRIHAPLVHTRWSLNPCVTEQPQPCPEFPPCYMGIDEAPATCNLLTAVSGTFTFGDMQTPWSYGRIEQCIQTRTRFADVDVILGYDMRQSDTSHFGFFGQLGFPTGNRFTARTLFEPIVGNAKHYEIGGGLSGHVVLLEHDAYSNLSFWAEGNVVHMVRNVQMRTFDFCENGPLSRYMLLKELKFENDSLVYAGNLINAVNFATRPVCVSIPAKGDVSAKLAVRTPHIIADLGYNFYGRAAERLCLERCDDDRIYAIKGTEGVCGREYQTTNNQFGPFVRDVPLNSSQGCATIRHGAPTDNKQVPPKVQPSDIVVTAYSRQEGSLDGADVIEAFVSSPPRLVSINDLHLASGTAPAQATHKVFGYLGWNFYEHDWCSNPYLGIGGEVEVDARSEQERSALNQWSFWIKGGFEF